MNDVQKKVVTRRFLSEDLVVVQMSEMSVRELEDHTLILEMFLTENRWSELQREMIQSRLLRAHNEIALRALRGRDDE